MLIVTLLDYTGPLLPRDIAREFSLPVDTVQAELATLLRSHHVVFSKREWVHYESSGLFDPDLDGEAGGYPTGPRGPKRQHGDDGQMHMGGQMRGGA